MGLMGKSKNNLATRMVKSLNEVEAPKRQPSVHIRKAENGYVVSKEARDYGPSKDVVFTKLSGVTKYLKECFGDHEEEKDEG